MADAHTLDPGTCRSCGAAILWGHTADNGKPMPLDPKPEKRVIQGRSGALHVLDTYVPHWSTCPNAKGHRRG